MPAKKNPAVSIREKILRKLSKRDYTEKELRDFLFSQGNSDDLSILDELKKYNYLNDKRFAENKIRNRKGSFHGIEFITSELKEKGISEEIIKEAILETPIEEWAENCFSYIKLINNSAVLSDKEILTLKKN